ncbi:methyltransferase domain-containing protein [Streptomyces sp. SID3343]|uniref:methyltransferase domain-containing protein n=1 Tax=Streptomyces sp. SID3343 TaxID=2690260 RepID=UPI001367E295|nr:methyltransferase domain-containing protein [Streptomyces sp. SID3343]MYV98435.1 methyltransferase domain-containing protein [Streptomyces sp. SID3343]
MTKTRNPSPADVGAMYDGFDKMDVLHFGYWEDPDDETPVAEAADRLTDLVIDRLGVTAGARLLDVGCGIGTPAVRMATRTGADVLGITISGKQVQRATELAASQGLGEQVRFELADAMDMPFPDGSFDSVYALESIIHMDRPQALREMARVVRPGGRIVLTDMYDRIPAPEGQPSLIHFMTEAWMMSELIGAEDYPDLAAAAGLRLVEVMDLSEKVLWRTLRVVAHQLRAQNDALVPEQIVDRINAEEPSEALDLPSLLENSRELGCQLVVLQRD